MGIGCDQVSELELEQTAGTASSPQAEASVDGGGGQLDYPSRRDNFSDVLGPCLEGAVSFGMCHDGHDALGPQP
jgi:hypothetical protein